MVSSDPFLTANRSPTAAGPREDPQLEVLADDECRTLLSLAAFGRIAFVSDGLPIVLPVNYRLLSDEAGLWVVLRTKPGNAIDLAPQDVAFEVDGVDHDHRKGWSVLIQGTLHHLDHNEVELLVKRFDPKPWPVEARTSWIAIKPRAVSGRRLHAAEWPYLPEAHR
ncbi:MAG: pyridoxamine 5'-phosphate oxidase family protein [Acidimicrobiales bacterium]